MSFELSTEDKKSLGITTVVYALLILLLFFLRFWPPADMKIMGGGGGGGIEMNFGDSDYGMGDNYKSEVLNVKDQAKTTPVAPTPEEDVISDDNSEANDAVVPKHETVKKTPVVIKKDIPKPAPEKPKVSKNANDALSSILGNKGGDGDDNKGGNKGSASGNLNSKGYYGNGSGTGTGGGNGSGNGTGSGSGSGSGNGSGSGGGNGSGSGYSLGNRKAISKPAPENPCGNESGRVAVQVKVDRNGNTISVTVGVQGTTNPDSCLKEQARKAAMQTKWSADPNADEIQVGKIIYGFNLN